MLLCLNIQATFEVITSFYIIIILQTKVHNCANLDIGGGCLKHFNNCELRLNCSSKNISSARLQCDNLEKVIVLYLDNNKINNIDNNIFEGLINLQSLSLRNNKIDKIQNHTFKPLRKLTYLDLRNNLIKDIQENAFDNLKSIWRIDLENNKIIRINSKVFKNCDKLNRVFLSQNSIEEIREDSFNEKSSVQFFYASRNKIRDLKFLKHFNILRVLHLSYNNIMEIPSNTLLQLKALQTLDLSHNKIESLNSGTFSELFVLENLSLSDNKLKYLGEGPFDYLHKLDHLDLSNNYLKTFSYSLIFEERNNLTLFIYIDKNNWYCKFVHAIKQFRWIKLRYEHINKNNSNIDGIPCLDKQKHSEEATTTRKQLTTLSTHTTAVETSITENLTTSTFLEITMTSFSSSVEVTTNPTKSSSIAKISSDAPKYIRSTILPEIKINITPYIITVAAVILLISIVIISVTLTRRRFSCENENESDISKDGYMLPAHPPQRRSNFYVTLESYNSYEEINELEHLYEEINVTYL